MHLQSTVEEVNAEALRALESSPSCVTLMSSAEDAPVADHCGGGQCAVPGPRADHLCLRVHTRVPQPVRDRAAGAGAGPIRY